MTKLKRKARALPLVALALLVVGGAGVFAQRNYLVKETTARPEVRIELAGTVERGSDRIALAKAGEVRPGEVLDWTLTSVNEGPTAARNFKAMGQIPKGTMLIVGSTTADGTAVVTYSIDNGRTFSVQPMVDEKQADGAIKRVPAPVSMYTQVRYEWTDALAAGSKLSAGYKVRVR